MSVQVNIHEAKTHFSQLIERVLQGESVTVARAGKPVVDIVPHVGKTVIFGLGKGEYSFDEDSFVSANQEIREMFYGDDE